MLLLPKIDVRRVPGADGHLQQLHLPVRLREMPETDPSRVPEAQDHRHYHKRKLLRDGRLLCRLPELPRFDFSVVPRIDVYFDERNKPFLGTYAQQHRYAKRASSGRADMPLLFPEAIDVEIQRVKLDLRQYEQPGNICVQKKVRPSHRSRSTG